MKLRLCLAAFALLVSCGSRGDKSAPAAGQASLKRLNVVLVTLDTLRPDRLACYGNSNVETPNLDRVAQRGVLFENAVAQAFIGKGLEVATSSGIVPPDESDNARIVAYVREMDVDLVVVLRLVVPYGARGDGHPGIHRTNIVSSRGCLGGGNLEAKASRFYGVSPRRAYR